jgi:hypothetical protein
MENIEVKMEGKIMVLKIDTTKDLGESKSGKNILIASTKGNVELVKGIMGGINIYKKK